MLALGVFQTDSEAEPSRGSLKVSSLLSLAVTRTSMLPSLDVTTFPDTFYYD